MEFKEIVDYILSNGMSAIIIGYFLWRDNKYTDQLITLMTELKQCIHKIGGFNDEDDG